MSRLVLRKRSQFRGRSKSSFWNASVPPFDEAIKNFFGQRNGWSWFACIPLALMIVATWNFAAHAQADEITAADVQANLDNAWVLIASILVIFMNAGFCMVETGFCRQKNAVNVLSKNLIVFALSTVGFWVLGFSLMFGTAGGSGFLGWGNFFLGGPAELYVPSFASHLNKDTFFIFQAAFAGTAATIVSGAVAERIKFVDFLIFSLLLTGIAYPITGHWVWAESGWLFNLGFHDFAGSTVVHSVGGWAALMGAAFLGPRIGKYQDGHVNALPGHNLSIATLGCLILWVCWFGFNPGSNLAANGAIAYIAVTTNIGGAVGGIAATITSWALNGKPDLSMTINGILAGLVSVTAGCYVIGYGGAFWLGLIGGIIVVFAVGFFDSIKIDDPVGATSVHLVCGIWGSLGVGLFANPNNATQAGTAITKSAGLFYGGGFTQLGIQLVGVLAIGLFTVVITAIFWAILKATLGIRVSPEEELKGLDIGEHGMEAYSGFLKDTSDIGGIM